MKPNTQYSHFEFQYQAFQMPAFLRRKADPKNVVSIILGGGPGIQLFPLTKRAATPAVSKTHHFLGVPLSC